jgi:hypothetical protein
LKLSLVRFRSHFRSQKLRGIWYCDILAARFEVFVKKILLWVILLWVPSVGAISANEEEPSQEPAVIEEVEKPAAKKPIEVKTLPQNQLVDLREASIKTRLRELERRVLTLEQENRFQDERLRNCDRSIDDIRRRHVRG